MLKVTSCAQNRGPSSNIEIHHGKSETEYDSPIRIRIKSGDSINSKNGSREHCSAQSIELQEVSEGPDSFELIKSKEKISGKQLKKEEENVQ